MCTICIWRVHTHGPLRFRQPFGAGARGHCAKLVGVPRGVPLMLESLEVNRAVYFLSYCSFINFLSFLTFLILFVSFLYHLLFYGKSCLIMSSTIHYYMILILILSIYLLYRSIIDSLMNIYIYIHIYTYLYVFMIYLLNLIYACVYLCFLFFPWFSCMSPFFAIFADVFPICFYPFVSFPNPTPQPRSQSFNGCALKSNLVATFIYTYPSHVDVHVCLWLITQNAVTVICYSHKF